MQAGQFRGDHSDVFSAFGNLQTGELFDGKRVGPVVRERAHVVEPIGVRHRREIARCFGNFFVITMEIAEYRLELYNTLAVQNYVHAEYTMRGRMMRSQRNFEQVAFAAAVSEIRRHIFFCRRCAAPCHALCCFAFTRTSSCAVGSYS